MIVIVTLLAWTFLNFSQFSVLGSFRQGSALRAFYAAEAGIRVYLSLPQEDQQRALRREFQLDGAEVVLLVEPVQSSGGTSVRVTATGRSGGVERRIVMPVVDGIVTNRSVLP